MVTNYVKLLKESEEAQKKLDEEFVRIKPDLILAAQLYALDHTITYPTDPHQIEILLVHEDKVTIGWRNGFKPTEFGYYWLNVPKKYLDELDESTN